MSGDLILYFSRAGENYYEGDLKVVEKGNTEVVADYIKETNNHVLYRVTPVFIGDNLVASGVLMEAESVEDNGE